MKDENHVSKIPTPSFMDSLAAHFPMARRHTMGNDWAQFRLQQFQAKAAGVRDVESRPIVPGEDFK